MEANLIYKNNQLEKIIFILIIFLPFSLVLGPFLSDLSVSIITLFFGYLSYKKKLYLYYNNIYSKIFYLFFILLLVTSFLSLDPLISLKKTIFYFRFWIFALAVWYIFNLKKKEFCKYLIISFTLVFIILIVDGYIQFFFKKNIFGWPIQDSRVSSFFKDELILGSYLSRLLPIYFSLLVFTNFEKKKLSFIIFFIIFVGIETLTFLSGERVAFFFVNASSIMLILTMKNYKTFRFLSLITSLILIIFLINIYPESTDRIVNKTITQLGFEEKTTEKTNNSISENANVIETENKNLNKKENTSKKYIFSLEHQNHYISSFRMFKDNIYTGIGPRMFRYICGLEKYYLWEGCSTHPHNTYVQLLTETGVFGFIFGAIIFIIIFYSVIKHFIFKFTKKQNIFSDFQLCLISAILISIWPFVPTGGFFNNWLNIIYFFPVGIYLSTIYPNNK